MITVPELAAEALGSLLTTRMSCRFGSTRANLIAGLQSAARLALECIGNSDALYHNVEHTMLEARDTERELHPHVQRSIRAKSDSIPPLMQSAQ